MNMLLYYDFKNNETTTHKNGQNFMKEKEVIDCGKGTITKSNHEFETKIVPMYVCM